MKITPKVGDIVSMQARDHRIVDINYKIQSEPYEVIGRVEYHGRVLHVGNHLLSYCTDIKIIEEGKARDLLIKLMNFLDESSIAISDEVPLGTIGQNHTANEFIKVIRDAKEYIAADLAAIKKDPFA